MAGEVVGALSRSRPRSFPTNLLNVLELLQSQLFSTVFFAHLNHFFSSSAVSMAVPDPTDDPRRSIQDRSDPSDDDFNPFIAFRRFADQQANSLLNAVTSLPSAFSSSFSERNQECPWKPQEGEAQRQRNERELERREDHEDGDDTGPFDRMFRDMERAMAREEKELGKLFESQEKAMRRGDKPHEDHVSEPKVWYWSWSWPPKSAEQREREKEEWETQVKNCKQGWNRGTESRWDPWFSSSHRHRPSFWGSHDDLYDEWEDYLLHDSYSPLQLEKSLGLPQAGTRWRQAYEDLLSTTAQEGTGSRSDLGRPYHTENFARTDLTPRQWIEHLQERHNAVIRHNVRHFSWHFPFAETRAPRIMEEIDTLRDEKQRSKRVMRRENEDTKQLNASEESKNQPQQNHDTTNDSDAEPQTELDMYERFLGSSSSPAPVATTSTPANHNPDLSAPQASTSSGSTILSTLTTTERKINPDGSVTTKIVLKKRFADGSEENSETVHTMRGESNRASQGLGNMAAPTKEADGPEGQQSTNKKGGWFWSS